MSKKGYDDLTDKELFAKYQIDKDIGIRDELIKRNMYVAEILSKKYAGKGIDYEDIFQVASMGLIYAIQRFDPDKGFEFSSFATPTIIGEIKKYFRDKGWSIRVPRRIQELSKKVNMAKVKLSQDQKRVPTVGDIAKELGVTQEEVLETIDASQAYSPISLDIKYDSDGEDKDMSLGELIGQDDRNYTEIENIDMLNAIMQDLTDVEKKIVHDRYFHGKTQMELASELDVSQMTISRMEKKILSKLRFEYQKQNSV